MFFRLHFIMNQKPGDGDGVQSDKTGRTQRVSVQNVAAEAEFCVSKGDHAAGIAVKAVHDFFHRKSVKIRVKLFDEKRRQTRCKRLCLLCPSPAWGPALSVPHRQPPA